MSDIVTILREWAHVEGICDGDPDGCVGAACDKAADEIERLRAYVAEIEGRPVLKSEWEKQQAEIERLRKENKNVGKGAERNAHINYEFAKKNNALRLENKRLRELLREWAKEFDDADWAETFVDMVRATNLDRRTKEALGDVPKPD